MSAEKKQNWRLKKTLARKLDFRLIEADDVRYAWVAYKKGCLKDMAAPFDNTDMEPEEFKRAFFEAVTQNYHTVWTLFGESAKGYGPVGFVFAFHAHPNASRSPFMVVGDIVWCPWASARNKVESAVHFFGKIRNDVPLMDYAYGEKNKKFMEMIAKHGVLRRIGTTFNVVKGEPCAIFETRKAA